ncbi:GNAT family acetyltransferase [Enterococcus sp. JM4C]|nr:GNAT family N-acetyltransferase [Enterococcus sp. JM4C]KAF1297281.1 GNAT family acetyltransferase [Enterococcus sp. JM4C]
MDCIFRRARLEDIDEIMAIEQASFTKEEAATKTAMLERIRLIPDSFLLAVDGETILGYVVGPVITSQFLTDDLFEKTVENPQYGGIQTILSLAVNPDHRGLGLAGRLLEQLKEESMLRKRAAITLTCLEPLIPYYKKFDYQLIGISESVHAGEVWYDMSLPLS